MDHQKSIIRLEGITYEYSPQIKVLNHIDFELTKGQKIGLVGDNGSGKTTMLHIIVGLISASSGKLFFENKLVENESDFRLVRNAVGLLFQNSDDQLFCPTVLEDVAFGPMNQGFSAEKARDIALTTLESLGLMELKDRITFQLSGGEKKLVALATILSMKPQVLLLDEPTAGLDESTRNKLSEILKTLNTTYIMVSHEFDFLAKNTDTIFGMKHGKIHHQGASSTLHSHVHAHPVGEIPHKHSHTEVE